MSSNEQQVNQPVMKTLHPNKMFALIVIEQNRDSLAQNELQQAEQNLRNSEAQLERAKHGLSEVQGAIIGANIMIERELRADGFTLEEWQRIKADHQAQFEKEQNAQSPQEVAPVEVPTGEEVEPEATTPTAKITQLKRRAK